MRSIFRLYSTNNTNNIRISSSEIAIQLYIQHSTHFECQAMGSTFSSTFENIHLEHRAMGFFIQLCIRKYSYSSSTYEIDVQLCIQHTLTIQLWDRHSAIFSKTYLFNIELLHQHSSLHSKPYTFEYRPMGSTFSSAFINILDIEL